MIVLAYLVAELHASHVRAHNSIVAAHEDIEDFRTRWTAFAKRAKEVIETLGSAAFTGRFTSKNTAPAVLDHLDTLVRQYNGGLEFQQIQASTSHVTEFDDSPEAHDGHLVSGDPSDFAERIVKKFTDGKSFLYHGFILF